MGQVTFFGLKNQAMSTHNPTVQFNQEVMLPSWIIYFWLYIQGSEKGKILRFELT